MSLEDQELKSEIVHDDSVSMNKPSQPLYFWDAIKIAITVIVVQIFVTLAVTVAYMAVGSEMDTVMAKVMGVSLALSFPAAAWYILNRHTLARSAWEWIGSYIELLPIGLLMLYAISYVIGGVLQFTPGYDAMLEDYITLFDQMNPTLLLIAGGFIGPVCEEIIFRGVILKGFLHTYNPRKAIIYSALIFGVIHFIPLQVISAFFAGLVLGYIYYKTKSLWLPIIIHVINNVLAFLLGVEAEQDASTTLFGSEGLYIASFAAALLIVYVAYLTFEYLHGPARYTPTDDHNPC